MATKKPKLGTALSTIEIKVLQLVADGLTNEQIGLRLRSTPESVKSRVRNILPKLGVHTRAHAVAEGFRRGLIQ